MFFFFWFVYAVISRWFFFIAVILVADDFTLNIFLLRDPKRSQAKIVHVNSMWIDTNFMGKGYMDVMWCLDSSEIRRQLLKF